MERLEAALYGTRPQRRPCVHWSSDALEILWPEVLQLKQSAEKFSCALTDDDCVWLGGPLQARREVRRFADDAALLRLARSDQVADHHQPGRNADAGLQGRVRLKPSQRGNQF